MDDGRTINSNYYNDYKSNYSTDYPPMPAFKQQYSSYPPSVQSNDDPSYYYGDQFDSKTNLAAAAAPMAGHNAGLTNPHSAQYDGNFGYGAAQNGGYGTNAAHDAYTGYGQDAVGGVPGAYGGDQYSQHQHQQYAYGQGQTYEQDVSHGYAYEPQADYTSQHQHQQPSTTHFTTQPPPRTASRAAQHGFASGNGYDAYGRV